MRTPIPSLGLQFSGYQSQSQAQRLEYWREEERVEARVKKRGEF